MTSRVLLTFAWFVALQAFAQLSPGELAKAHAHLEGLSNCATCHTLGSKSFQEKCLSCHKSLAERVAEGKGLHAGKEYERCQNCHSDHHGSDYALIHWPKGRDAFDHKLTGFELEGKHQGVACLKCHKDAESLDKKIPGSKNPKQKQGYLGLSTACLSCHKDQHNKQLSEDCLACHDFSGWKPAPSFNHAKAAFSLEGAHRKVDCVKCHPSERLANLDTDHLRFKPVAHQKCSDCHQDLHRGTLKGGCESCHSLEAFKPAPGFDHNRTRFPLLGKHARTSCEPCHPNAKSKEALVFATQIQGPLSECQSCHKDPHQQRLGSKCESCHNSESWKEYRTKAFSHEQTRFPLVGLHQQVACAKCHGKSLKIASFQECRDCHRDIHNGQFKQSKSLGACKACHDERGWKATSFGIARHNETLFPLRDAHLATPCFACHLAPSRGKPIQFKFQGSACTLCHQDIHKGDADAFMKAGDCSVCHKPTDWHTFSFDHQQTRFPLEGAHAKATCLACHAPLQKGERPRLAGHATRCMDCHEDRHGGQFKNLERQTPCETCHQPQSWRVEKFDHSRSRFALDGAHAQLACNQCHKPLSSTDSRMKYKPIDPRCSTCHAKAAKD